MKKVFCFLMFFCFSASVFAQMVVSDVGAKVALTKVNASMVSSLSKAGTQIKIASDQYKLYKDNLDKLKKVSAIIQRGKLAIAVVDNFTLIENTINNTSDNILKISPKHRKTWINSFNMLLEEVYVMSETSTMVISNNALEMNDSERLSSLLEIYKLSNEVKAKTAAFNRRVNQMQY